MVWKKVLHLARTEIIFRVLTNQTQTKELILKYVINIWNLKTNNFSAGYSFIDSDVKLKSMFLLPDIIIIIVN